MMNTNEFEGAARDIKGKLKDGYGGLTGDTGTQVDGKLDQAAGKIQARFGDTIDQAGDAASTLANKASATASDVSSKLRETARNVQAEARQAGEAVYAASARAGEAVTETVRQQPMLAMLGIAAIGYFASFLIHSPSSPFAPREPDPKYLPRSVSRYLR